MIKAFSIGLTGILFSTGLGVFAATTAVNASSAPEALVQTAMYID